VKNDNQVKKTRKPKKPSKKNVDNLSPLERAMFDPNISAEKLQLLIGFEEKRRHSEAVKAFDVAMLQVQRELHSVPEDSENEQTHSQYASYKAILKFVKPVYLAAGFALSFHEEDTEKIDEVRVSVDVMHDAGHVKTYHYDSPMDDKGFKGTVNKTRPHAKGSSVSYGRSYLMKMIFNLLTGEEDDDDGNGAGGDPLKVNDKQIERIKELRTELGLAEEEFQKRMKKRYSVDCPRRLNKEQADELIKTLTNMVANTKRG
jgi:hypothetical protein